MAGSYADVPGSRIPYNTNGSTVEKLNSDATSYISTFSQSDMDKFANDDSDIVITTYNYVAVLFPHAFTLEGAFVRGTRQVGSGTAYQSNFGVSTDTTNGIDGTWTAVTEMVNTDGFSRGGYSATAIRNELRDFTSAFTGVVGIRFFGGATSASAWVYNLHLYGRPDSGVNQDSLRLWDPSSDVEITDGAYFDWDDQPQYGVLTKTFRIKNISGTLTANTVAIATENTSTNTPTFSSQFEYKVGAGAYGSTASLGNLSPGSISSVVTCKLDLTTPAALSLHWARANVTAASWS